uniref:D-alanyl-D-alanine carboxypeptidase family protein n=1 Tax=Lachnoclostridium phocaeense TaxID=1871021 RepID=UPI0026DD4CF3|nr:D-alanyl-D-alanine carboxypeptidase family protein [Lachnoclostridium phocaeense]
MIKRKKKAGLFLASVLLTLVLAACPCICRAASQTDEEETPEELAQLYARSAVLMDADSGRVLFEKDGKTARPIASTTKIMTCILALEEGKPDLVCSVSEKAASQPEVRLGVREGETYLLEDLLYSLMLESHNDSAVVIAENTAGSVEAFAGLMNKKSEEIGCQDTYFITPNGLDASDEGGTHSATAEDLARILRYCIMESPKREAFLTVTRTDSYSFTDLSGQRSFSLQNHNAFLSMMEGALTGKTGFTADAGYCYVGALENGGRTFIVALLACGWPNNKGYKWEDTKKLMQYGINHYQYETITLDQSLPSLPISGGAPPSGSLGSDALALLSSEPFQKELLMAGEEAVTAQVKLPAELDAPVEEGQEVGEILYRIGEFEVGRQKVEAAISVPERDLLWCLDQIIVRFFAGKNKISQ